MSASAATRLRQLATQYHGGELDLQSYRRMRAELLDRLSNASGESDELSSTSPQRRPYSTGPASPVSPPAVPAPVVPAAAAPPPTVAAPAPVAAAPAPVPVPAAPTHKRAKAAPAAAPQPAPVQAAPPPAKKNTMPLVIASVVGVIAIGAGLLYFMRSSPNSPGAAAEQAAMDLESYQAINDFLTADDWSDEQIANFNVRWTTLPDDMRAAALDQSWYRNFVERVRSRVKEQRALTASAESAGTVEGPLAALASNVGIDISSPDLPVPNASVIAADVSKSMEKEAGGAAKEQTKGSSAPPAQPVAGVQAPAPATATTSRPAASAAPAAQAAKSAAVAAIPASTRPAARAPVADNSPDRCRVELVNSRRPRCRDALHTGGFGPYMAVIPAGEFEMGSKSASQEQPVHRVEIPKPFAIAEFETSQAEYRLFCSNTKRTCESQPWAGDDLPVVKVSWQDARDYVEWLSETSGRNYRLATEAEWEYAARGGSAALFPSGEALAQTDAVFSGVTKATSPGSRNRQMYANTSKENAPRLFHSIGNVREWVEDAWSPGYAGAPADGSARKSADTALRVVRGGAYADQEAKLRFTTREGLDPSTRDSLTGFRIVREF